MTDPVLREIPYGFETERSAALTRRAGYQLEATLRHHECHHLTIALRDTLIFVKFEPCCCPCKTASVC